MSEPSGGYASGPFGRGGTRPVAVEINFHGNLGAAFVAFATERARRLSLDGTIRPGETDVLVMVSGPEALVGAFETACCIGPDDAEVFEWNVRSVGVITNEPGFRMV